MFKGSPNIVVTDAHTLNPGDLSWNKLKALGSTSIFDFTPPDLLLERVKDADIILPNKTVFDASMLKQLDRLKCICVTASGYNNIDISEAKKRGIIVCNAVGYSSPAVAQHVFALLLGLINKPERHFESIRAGVWSKGPHFCFTLSPIMELSGKTMGIYGFGRIGQHVAQIAQAFGMQVIASHKHPERDARAGVRFVELEELLKKSDVLSLHAPLNDQNKGIISKTTLDQMKPSAYLINTGRGGLIVEEDLRQALLDNKIAGAGLDVLSVEPPAADHILFDAPNCLITPHNAWAIKESRERLLEICVGNVRAFLSDQARNLVY